MSTSARTVFRGSSGELTGKLEMPIGDPKAWALFAHCFTCGKDNAAAGRISRALAAQGIAVLRFDFTGLGESEGEFAATGFSSNVEDLVHAADHLRDQFSAPAVLIGHSLGGAAVLADPHLEFTRFARSSPSVHRLTPSTSSDCWATRYPASKRARPRYRSGVDRFGCVANFSTTSRCNRSASASPPSTLRYSSCIPRSTRWCR